MDKTTRCPRSFGKSPRACDSTAPEKTMIANPFPRIPYAEAARDLLRDSVMTAVDELIRRNGWAATSVAAVAAAAGVSRQTIYKEFGSRRSLADAYIVRRLDELMDAVDKIMADAPDTETGLRDA